MRRAMLLAATVAIAVAGVAVAASYQSGRYKAGTSKGDGVTLRVHQGSFSVARVSFEETCTSDSDSFSERFAFVKGSNAKLNGTIDGEGHLSGRYESNAGKVTITGRVKGHKATVKAKESGSFQPSTSTATYNCAGSHTFHAKLAK
jgi:hypothetical protein